MTRRLAATLFLALLTAGCSAGATPAPSSLAAGTYTSKVFTPAATYTLPTGWTNPDDSAVFLSLVPAGSDYAGTYLFRNPQPASQDSSCPESPAPGIMATSSSTLMNWIRGRPGLTVSTPRLVTVGGLPGVELDVAIKSGWKNTCPFANGLPSVPLFVGPNGEYRWVIAGSEQLRLDILDRPGGGTVVVDIDAFDGSVYQSLLQAATPIVQSLRFATG